MLLLLLQLGAADHALLNQVTLCSLQFGYTVALCMICKYVHLRPTLWNPCFVAAAIASASASVHQYNVSRVHRLESRRFKSDTPCIH